MGDGMNMCGCVLRYEDCCGKRRNCVPVWQQPMELGRYVDPSPIYAPNAPVDWVRRMSPAFVPQFSIAKREPLDLDGVHSE